MSWTADGRRPTPYRPPQSASRSTCSTRSGARCASMPAAGPLYSTDASNYRQVPIGVVVPRDAEDVVAAIEVCRAHDVPIVSRGGGTEPRRPELQRRRRARPLQVQQPAPRARPGRTLGARPARPRPRRAARRRRGAPADLRAGSRDPRPLHPRRDDRQQLVRRALGHGRQDRRQRPRARGPRLRRHPAAGRADER